MSMCSGRAFYREVNIQMEKLYKTDILLTTNNCDMAGRWKPSAIMDAMQEAAGRHGELLGFGRKDLAPMGIVWVITRLEVMLDRIPTIGETVRLETFPTAVRRWFFPRYYVFKAQDGEVLGRAATLWVVMDWRTRRMASPDGIKHLLPDNSDLPVPMGLPSPVTDVDGRLTQGEYHPVYSDLDVNGHVNNTRYMDLCCNALGIDLLRERAMTRFMLTFDREIRPEQTVTTELRLLDGAFTFSGREGDTRFFEVGGQLA